jgi:hypothetical protein
MVWYAVAFVASALVDSIPFFAPPAWMILVFLLVKFDLNPWAVIALGSVGTALGRYTFASYIPWIGKKALSRRENGNLKFLGSRLAKREKSTFLFVLIYSLTPLSTTALFTAVGLSHINKVKVLIPFVIGKLVSNSILIFSGHFVAMSFSDFTESMFSVKGIAMGAVGLVIIGGFLFIDWRELLEKKHFKFNFKIWG